VQWSFTLTVLLTAQTQCVADAEAKLLGNDEPVRVPNVYIVVASEKLSYTGAV
jgi:hypothetical protein